MRLKYALDSLKELPLGLVSVEALDLGPLLRLRLLDESDEGVLLDREGAVVVLLRNCPFGLTGSLSGSTLPLESLPSDAAEIRFDVILEVALGGSANLLCSED